MSTLLENLAELVKMIFAVIVIPNYGASSSSFSIMNLLLDGNNITAGTIIKGVLILSFGIGCLGVSIGLLKRLLCRN